MNLTHHNWLTPSNITAKLTNQLTWTGPIPLDGYQFFTNSDENFHSVAKTSITTTNNSSSQLKCSECSDNAIVCYPWVQTIYWMGRLTLKFLRTVKLKNSFLLYLIIYTDLLLIWRWQATGWWWWCTLCCAQKSSRNTCCAFHLWNIKSSILMTQFTKHYIGNSVFSIASYRNLTRSGRHWVYNCTPDLRWQRAKETSQSFSEAEIEALKTSTWTIFLDVPQKKQQRESFSASWKACAHKR